MARKVATLADVNGESASFRAMNPHLFRPVKAPEPAQIADSRPVSASKGIRGAPVPKTRPEREMMAMLEKQAREGRIESVEFEGMTLSIGAGVRYTPDFMVWTMDGTLRFVETKGPFVREDSIVKYKCAKGKYVHCEFELWQLTKEGWSRIA